MKSDLVTQMYFGRLYSTEEYNKINLCSSAFLLDAVDFYCKKANENEREMLIKGIRFLAFRIRIDDELREVLRTWDNITSLMTIRAACWGIKARKELNPNLVVQFMDEVDNILETRNAELEEKKRNIEGRKKKELDNLKEELIKEREFNTLLRKMGDTTVQNVKYIESNDKFEKNDNKPDFSCVLLKIKYDKNEATKKKFEYILNQLNERELHDRSNNKDFTTIAWILFRKEFVVNIGTFSEWLGLISSAFNRATPKYKPNSIKNRTETIERKFPFLNPPS